MASEPQLAGLDLSSLPPIFVSATHFDDEELHELEDDLDRSHAVLTFDIQEARIVISKVLKRARVKFDLRSKGLWSTDFDDSAKPSLPVPNPAVKTKHGTLQSDQIVVVEDSTTEDETEGPKKSRKQTLPITPALPESNVAEHLDAAAIYVVTVDWFYQSRIACKPLPLQSFLTYKGQPIEKPDDGVIPASAPTAVVSDSKISSPLPKLRSPLNASKILERAKQDATEGPQPKPDRFGKRKFGHGSVPSESNAAWAGGKGKAEYAHMLHESTTEHEDGYSSDLPEMPEWVRQGIKYACQRVTPENTPNDAFIEMLKIIRLARELTNDEIGVRAYSTSIAAICSYPYKISNPREIVALPGCDVKIANLFVEWKNTGLIKAVSEIEADPDLTIVRMFYDIWGVGPSTAREFYYDKGWRELDDIVDYGWSTLSRVQQIGVKYYEEFKDLIPRAEVEQIAQVIHDHAVKVRDARIQSLLVGGYRRGKKACGDVDIIVSHPDEEQTNNIIHDIVSSLEDEGWITHTLTLSLHNSKRGQQTLPFKASANRGAGFDTLDKALVVWQNPEWPGKAQDQADDLKAKNPNIHRRVDIIIAPWRTVGCAVVGWSGGTTFERDLRRLAKYKKAWKFDSSGVRDRANGEVVDVEGYYRWKGVAGVDGRAKTMLEAEKRVFESFGLVYREPWERCTN